MHAMSILGTGATAANKLNQTPALKELTASEACIVNPFYKCATKAQRGNSLFSHTKKKWQSQS